MHPLISNTWCQLSMVLYIAEMNVGLELYSDGRESNDSHIACTRKWPAGFASSSSLTQTKICYFRRRKSGIYCYFTVNSLAGMFFLV